MLRKSPSLQLVLVMAGFLIIACSGSLPFALPFARDETSPADQESVTANNLTQEQLVCPIDKSTYTVLREEESGCYLPISVQEQPAQGEAFPTAQDSITIYTVLSKEQLACYLPILEREHPEIQVKWYRAATWELTDKILTEKSDPHADVIWGLAATATLRVQAEGMLEPYAPAGLGRVNPRMRDTRADPPYWIGHDVWMSAFCVNTVEMEKLGLPMPTSWGDLVNPVYKGYLVMPNPNSSGTGFLSVSAWLQLFITKDERATDLVKWAEERGVEGEEAAWAYMDALHENMILYTDSGSKPCTLAATGKIPIGISFGSEAVEQRELGHPIVAVFPEEGSGWEVETVALIRKPEIKLAAKTFIDWAIGDSAMEAYAYFYPVTSVPTDVPPPEGYVAEPTKQLIKNRFLWASANYDRIVAEWLKRYENKTESGADVPPGFE
jgi:iron(III) transport system substrate-binding protein